MTKKTGLLDKNGIEIVEGDKVSLAGNMTTDDSLGFLPNGWSFDDKDVYEVFFDESVQNWSLRLGIVLDNNYNIKYANHAVSLLHNERVEIVET
ncbi:MAG: hypothetical protein AAF298_00400 [Cyanobacteria bacterium P01_A01_bin.40]